MALVVGDEVGAQAGVRKQKLDALDRALERRRLGTCAAGTGCAGAPAGFREEPRREAATKLPR